MKRQKEWCLHRLAVGFLLTGLLAGCGMVSWQKEGDTAKGTAKENEEETVLFRLAETMPETHPSARAAKYFAELVEERSQGKIKIRVYYDEELGTPGEIIEQMKFGGIAMARVNSLELSDAIPALCRHLTPETYTGAGDMIESFHRKDETLRNICQLEKITPLTWYYPDLRCIYSSDQAIEGRANLKGVKVKTTKCQVMEDIMMEMGAESIGVSGANLYHSLSSGAIQYAESGFCEFICRDYGKYIHYVMVTDYAYFPDVLLINTECLNSLNPSEKELLETCADETYEYQRNGLLTYKKYWTEELDKNDKIQFSEKGFN